MCRGGVGRGGRRFLLFWRGPLAKGKESCALEREGQEMGLETELPRSSLWSTSSLCTRLACAGGAGGHEVGPTRGGTERALQGYLPYGEERKKRWPELPRAPWPPQQTRVPLSHARGPVYPPFLWLLCGWVSDERDEEGQGGTQSLSTSTPGRLKQRIEEECKGGGGEGGGGGGRGLFLFLRRGFRSKAKANVCFSTSKRAIRVLKF